MMMHPNVRCSLLLFGIIGSDVHEGETLTYGPCLAIIGSDLEYLVQESTSQNQERLYVLYLFVLHFQLYLVLYLP